MNYRDVYSKAYYRTRNDDKCRQRRRDPARCPANTILDRLIKPVYGPDLECTACESSMSLVSRPDPFFGVLKYRASRQIHVFEAASSSTDLKSYIGSLDIRCPSAAERQFLEQSGKWKNVPFCTTAYLRPPRYMSKSSHHVLPLLDSYSIHGGLLPFLCTPYLAHHRLFGYVCAQAAVYLCLEMMLPLGSCPHSPATISHIVSTLEDARNYDPPDQDDIAFCSEHHPENPDDEKHSRGFYCMGLYPPQIKGLLNNDFLNTRALQFDASYKAKDLQHCYDLVGLHVKAMLDSRLPVIALVSFNDLVQAINASITSDGTDAHVITIIGYTVRSDEKLAGLIFHDGHLGAYREISLEAFVDCARCAPDGRKLRAEGITMYSPIPRELSGLGYLRLFHTVDAVAEKEGTHCSMKLMTVGQIPNHLSTYVAGHSASYPDGDIKGRLRPTKADDHPIWMVVYRQHDPKGTVILDLIDAEGDVRRRLGTIHITHAHDVHSACRFVQVTDDERSIIKNPILTRGFGDGAKHFPIRLY